ncbi:MAG: N-acetyltransferase [Lysobacter sp.]|nr:MAG: N-acetyltransferase [Lysobacter sp.]
MPLPTLSTANLDLSPLIDAHEGLYRALYCCPRVMARIAPPLDEGAASRAFRAVVGANEADEPACRVWAVTERSTRRDVGIGALLHRAPDTEMGLMLLPAAWNARYSHEVIEALVTHAFDDLAIDRLSGMCQAGPNERMSRRLLCAQGFVDAPPDRPGTARWILDHDRWRRPVGMGAADG